MVDFARFFATSVQSIIGAIANFIYFSIIYIGFLNYIEIGRTGIAGFGDKFAFPHPIFQSVTISMSPNTVFLLMAQYNGKTLIPLEEVRRDFFSHLTLPKFLRKLGSGEIGIPLVRIERSQKSARSIHLQDLASYLDKRREVSVSEARAFRQNA